VTINSAVDAVAGGSGALTDRGLFDTASNKGTVVVRGRLCIGG
jgi:hypothetical protein